MNRVNPRFAALGFFIFIIRLVVEFYVEVIIIVFKGAEKYLYNPTSVIFKIECSKVPILSCLIMKKRTSMYKGYDFFTLRIASLIIFEGHGESPSIIFITFWGLERRNPNKKVKRSIQVQ